MNRPLKILLPFVILGAGAGLAVVMIAMRQKVEPEPVEIPVPLVRTVKVAPQSHRFKVHAQGSVAPHIDINLTAEVAGRVIWTAPSFANGGFFDKGDVLIRIEQADYELAVTRANSALAQAKVALEREQAEADVARREWKSLGEGGQPNPLLLHEPQLAEAQAAVGSAQAALKQAELDLDRCQIKAPFAGRIWNKRVDIGQYVRKGDEVARVYSVDYAEVRLPLPLDQTAYLDLPVDYRDEKAEHQGPGVTLRARFGNETHEWQGRIVRTEGEIDPRTRMLTVVARVDQPYSRVEDAQRPPLAVGLFVDAEIEGKSAGQVTLVPRAAMRGTNYLMVVDSESRLRLRPVDVIRFERDQVVLRDGLQPGDVVCVSPLDAPVDKMKVRVTNPEAAVVTEIDEAAAFDKGAATAQALEPVNHSGGAE